MKSAHARFARIAIVSVCLLPFVDDQGSEWGLGPQSDVERNEKCELVQWDRRTFAHPYLTIRKAGKYCIGRDYHLTCVNGAGECGGGPLIEIVSDDVDLDLAGHTLARKGRPIQISALGFNISIRNGSIRNGNIRIRTPDSPNEPINAYTYPSVVPSPNGVSSVEGINLVDGSIFVSGANVYIGHNEITPGSEDLAGISVYGPSAKITKNRIHRNTTRSDFHSYGIYLRNGSGSEIRENTVENRGVHQNAFSIGLQDSRGVRIVNNQLRNFSGVVERIGLSDDIQTGNFVR